MKDFSLMELRRREANTVTVLRRIIAGDYTTVTEAADPRLEELGFSFQFSRVSDRPSDRPITHYFTADTVPEGREPILGLQRSKGEWLFIFDCGGTLSSDSLWLLSLMDYPDRFIKGLSGVVSGTGIHMRPMKCGWLVGVKASLLKHLTKNANRGTNEFQGEIY